MWQTSLTYGRALRPPHKLISLTAGQSYGGRRWAGEDWLWPPGWKTAAHSFCGLNSKQNKVQGWAYAWKFACLTRYKRLRFLTHYYLGKKLSSNFWVGSPIFMILFVKQFISLQLASRLVWQGHDNLTLYVSTMLSAGYFLKWNSWQLIHALSSSFFTGDITWEPKCQPEIKVN